MIFEWSFNNIDFNHHSSIEANTDEFIEISNFGNTFLSDENTIINIYQLTTQDSLSGHFEGTGKLLIEDLATNIFSVEEIFNLFVTINHLNQVLILPKEENSSFKYISGTYLPTGEFNGSIHKDSLIGYLNNNNSNPFNYTSSTFNDTLNVNINNIEKKLAITLQKN